LRLLDQPWTQPRGRLRLFIPPCASKNSRFPYVWPPEADVTTITTMPVRHQGFIISITGETTVEALAPPGDNAVFKVATGATKSSLQSDANVSLYEHKDNMLVLYPSTPLHLSSARTNPGKQPCAWAQCKSAEGPANRLCRCCGLHFCTSCIGQLPGADNTAFLVCLGCTKSNWRPYVSPPCQRGNSAYVPLAFQSCLSSLQVKMLTMLCCG